MILKTKQKLALARAAQKPILGIRYLLGLGTEVEARRSGIDWALDLREGIDFAIYLTGKFEHRTVRAIAALVNPGDTVIDIGANIGAHTLPLARLVGPQGHIFALEPTHFAYEKLCQNVARNPDLSQQTTVEQVMLTGSSEAALEPALYSSWPLAKERQEHVKHGGRAMSTEGAVSTTLDDYVESRKIAAVKLLKIDVDGFEVDVLKGCANLLSHQKPIIVMELAPYTLEERGQSLEALLEILDRASYRLTDEATGKNLSSNPATLRSLVPDGGSVNVIAKTA